MAKTGSIAPAGVTAGAGSSHGPGARVPSFHRAVRLLLRVWLLVGLLRVVLGGPCRVVAASSQGRSQGGLWGCIAMV